MKKIKISKKQTSNLKELSTSRAPSIMDYARAKRSKQIRPALSKFEQKKAKAMDKYESKVERRKNRSNAKTERQIIKNIKRTGSSFPMMMNKPKAKFPDLSGDGKVTKKDILIGRGVIDKPKMLVKKRKDYV